MSVAEAAGASVLVSDAELIDAVRLGDSAAYAELWRRHHRAALVAARSVTSSIDPDDLVSEAFAKILVAIRNGNGPKTAFRAYLLTAVRNTAASWGGSSKEVTLEDFDVEDPKFSEENTLAALDASLTADAFRALPQRWQEVLWYTEVERMAPADVAPLLGLKPAAVPALAYRAREGLRQAWIQAHFTSAPQDSECRWAIGNLGANARLALRQRDRARMDEHLETCARCSVIADEANGIAAGLALVLLPLTIGGAAAAGYLAWAAGTSAASAAAASGGGLVSALLGPSIKQNVLRAGTAGTAATVVIAGFAVVHTPARPEPAAAAPIVSHSAPAASADPLSNAVAPVGPTPTPTPSRKPSKPHASRAASRLPTASSRSSVPVAPPVGPSPSSLPSVVADVTLPPVASPLPSSLPLPLPTLPPLPVPSPTLSLPPLPKLPLPTPPIPSLPPSMPVVAVDTIVGIGPAGAQVTVSLTVSVLGVDTSVALGTTHVDPNGNWTLDGLSQSKNPLLAAAWNTLTTLTSSQLLAHLAVSPSSAQITGVGPLS